MAQLVTFLASDASRCIVAADIVIDGGLSKIRLAIAPRRGPKGHRHELEESVRSDRQGGACHRRLARSGIADRRAPGELGAKVAGSPPVNRAN
ncbi:MAG: hypothetical protein R3D69_16190 [Xanthobacteraceae bacterium]